MKISADFTVIPDAFAKARRLENCIDGTPIVSFPFYIDALDPAVQFLHWEFVDPDSIPVCGFSGIIGPSRTCPWMRDVRFQRFSRARDSG